MSESNIIHSTFAIERHYPALPEKVFAAFADPASKRRWFAESDSHTIQDFAVDLRIGGAEILSYKFKAGTPLAGAEVVNEGSYQDVVPQRRIVTASRMTIGNRIVSVTLVTIELQPADSGTDLICTLQGVYYEGSGGPQMREAGWRSLFERLGKELA